jgi:hypothetical protein
MERGNSMHIDFTLQIDDKKIDLSMNSKQCIGEVTKDVLGIRKDLLSDYYLSCMQQRMISAYKTLEEENIKNGDRLVAVRR